MTQHNDGPRRIVYIDGLRGVAIAMVLLFHAWYHYLNIDFATYHARTLVDGALLQCAQGVSLFLVISGFCLSYPLWQRRAAGAAEWFRPSVFLARRTLRILPPYYVALSLFVGVNIVCIRFHWPQISMVGAPLTGENVLSHLFLVHNLTPFRWSINGSFWSLGLEWQWYWIFPLVLVVYARSLRVAMGLCAAAAIIWHLQTHDLWDVGALPARLFEFCCGVAAAQVIVMRTSVARRLLVLGTIVPLMVLQLPPIPSVSNVPHAFLLNHVLHPIATLGLAQPLWGIVFACVLLLGYYSRVVNAILSWHPLVGLGVVSYSVYLVHEPVVQAVVMIAPAAIVPSLLLPVVALACGIALGVVFHVYVERPCMRRSTWQRLAPVLVRLFVWTDVLWDYMASKRLRQRARGTEAVANATER